MTTLILLSSLAAAQVSPDAVQSIQQFDDQLTELGFTLSFQLETAASRTDPTQGMRLMHTLYSHDTNRIGVRSVVSYTTEPVHQRLGTHDYREQDYDPGDRLIHWRTIAQDALSTPEQNVALLTVVKDKTSENGDFYSGASPIPVQNFYRYGIGTNEGHVLEGQALMALGRGFGVWLETTQSVEQKPGGLVEVIAQGNFGPGSAGQWTLTCDPAKQWLVRAASFVQAGESSPRIMVTSDGYLTVHGATTGFAASGSFRHMSLPEHVAVRVAAESASSDVTLLEELELEMLLQPAESVHERDRRR